MVRMGEWKLIYDMMGYGQLHHLPSDPHEVENRLGRPKVATPQAQLMAELPHRRAPAGSAYIP